MKLSEKLKSIYSSENTYTVLQLLQKMIEVVEEDEALHGLYEHMLTVQGRDAPSTTIVKVITTSPNTFHYYNESGPARYKSDGKIVSIVGADGTIWGTYYDRDSLWHYNSITDDGIVERLIESIVSEEVTEI